MMMESNQQVLELTFETELGAVIMNWNGFSSSGEFYEANESVLRLLKENNARKIVADLRNMKIIKLEDQQWLYKDWLPRAIRAGLEYVAIVESEDFFNRLSVDNVSQQINGQLNIKYFNTYSWARNWIRKA